MCHFSDSFRSVSGLEAFIFEIMAAGNQMAVVIAGNPEK
jgi:hypothetical protein